MTRPPSGEQPDGSPSGYHGREVRPWLGIFFTCCRVYARIYLNRGQTAFTGHCPRCARPIRVKVSPDGSPDRFWLAE